MDLSSVQNSNTVFLKIKIVSPPPQVRGWLQYTTWDRRIATDGEETNVKVEDSVYPSVVLVPIPELWW